MPEEPDLISALTSRIPNGLSERVKKEIANFLVGMIEATEMGDLYADRGDIENAKRKDGDADWYWQKAIERGYKP
jgi:hypothetical protein